MYNPHQVPLPHMPHYHPHPYPVPSPHPAFCMHPNHQLMPLQPFGEVNAYDPFSSLYSIQQHHNQMFQEMERTMDMMMSHMFGGRGGFLSTHHGFGPSNNSFDIERSRPRVMDIASVLRGFDHMELDENPVRGNFHSQVFISSSHVGSDGRVHSENYFNNRVQGMTPEGNLVGQSDEMYKNTGTGEKRMAQERRLNNQASKIVKSRNANGK